MFCLCIGLTLVDQWWISKFVLVRCRLYRLWRATQKCFRTKCFHLKHLRPKYFHFNLFPLIVLPLKALPKLLLGPPPHWPGLRYITSSRFTRKEYSPFSVQSSVPGRNETKCSPLTNELMEGVTKPILGAIGLIQAVYSLAFYGLSTVLPVCRGCISNIDLLPVLPVFRLDAGCLGLGSHFDLVRVLPV